jgi:hypothetical protein
MVETFEHPIFGTLFCIVLLFCSFLVADARRMEWTTVPIRSAVQAVKDKKMGFLKDIRVRALHPISSQI